MLGVVKSRVGYTGGSTRNPTYRSIGDHTETVALDFDPDKISYKELLDHFWSSHNPHSQSHNRQYMPAIFYHGTKQKLLAEETKDELQKQYSQPITTQILPAETFYNAEDYHQKYLLRQHRELLEGLNLSDEEIISSPVSCKLNAYISGHGNGEDLEKNCADFGLSQTQTSYVKKQFMKKKQIY